MHFLRFSGHLFHESQQGLLFSKFWILKKITLRNVGCYYDFHFQEFLLFENWVWDFSGGAAVKAVCFQGRGRDQGTDIPHAWHNQQQPKNSLFPSELFHQILCLGYLWYLGKKVLQNICSFSCFPFKIIIDNTCWLIDVYQTSWLIHFI